jgi:hypothetical protein
MKINFIREFQKDLNIVIINKLHNKAHLSSSSYYFKGLYWVLAASFYIMAKPWYIYYIGKLERKFKIKKLKDEQIYCV